MTNCTYPKVDVRQVALAYWAMDKPSRELDIGIIHGLSSGMYRSGNLFDHAVSLLKSGVIKRLGVVGGDGRRFGGDKPHESWIGVDLILEELSNLGIAKKDVIVTDSITNSKEEVVAINKLAKENGFGWVGSISVTYHGGRLLPYMVAAMKESGYWFQYYLLPPKRTNWLTPMLSSQGIKQTTCYEAACEDAVKLEDHIDRGWAANFDEVFDYLRTRDNFLTCEY